MKNNIDDLLNKAMQPDMIPSDELNDKILNAKVKGKKNKFQRIGTRVAAVVLGIALATPAVAFAAEQIKKLRNAYVTDDSISMGNPDYIVSTWTDAEEEVTTENLGKVEGTADDKWTYKEEIKLSSGAKNTFYGYNDYKTALEDTKLDNWFNKEYEKYSDESEVTYCIVEFDGYFSYQIDASFKYNNGYFDVNEAKSEGNIAEDASYTIALTKTENSREYVNKAGAGFVLIDDRRIENNGEDGAAEEVVTVVIVKYGNYSGFLKFYNLSEDEIHQILDTLTIKNDGEQ